MVSGRDVLRRSFTNAFVTVESVKGTLMGDGGDDSIIRLLAGWPVDIIYHTKIECCYV